MVPATSKDGNATQPTHASSILSNVTMGVMVLLRNVETHVSFQKQRQRHLFNMRVRTSVLIALSFAMELVLRAVPYVGIAVFLVL